MIRHPEELELIKKEGFRKISGEELWCPCGPVILFTLNGSLSVTIEGARDRQAITGPAEDVPDNVILQDTCIYFSTVSPCLLKAEPSCVVFIMKLNPEAFQMLPSGSRLLQSTSHDFSPATRETLLLLVTDYLSSAESSRHVHLNQSYTPESGRRAALHKASILLNILYTISEDIPDETPTGSRITLSPRRQALFDGIMRYISDHSGQGISQSEAAAQFGITPQYLGKFMRETTGLTFKQFEKQHSLTDSHPVFTQFGSDQSGRDFPGEEFTYTGRLSDSFYFRPGSSRIISVRLEPKHRFPSYWKRLINLGYADNLKSLRVEQTLTAIQRNIGFKYGRICRILDLVLNYTIGSRTIYDYSAVFSLLDLLIENNMIPFLELGNKTFMIQESNVSGYAPFSPEDSKTYYPLLLHVLPDFLRACVNRYGQEEFDKWHFEVSYTYTDNGKKDPFTFHQYIRVFKQIKSILRLVSENAKIGGPGFNDWKNTAQIRRMLKSFAEERVMPDFFTVYIYPLIGEEGKWISEDPDTPLKRMNSFSEIVHSEHPGSEVWVTEFNSNLSSRNSLNDVSYQASYIARNLVASSQAGIHAIGYYLLSDDPLRYLDSLEFMFGGWGLYTDSGIPKASGNAYRMFSMLGEYLIHSGQNAIVTADSRGSFQILSYHYTHPTPDFCRNNAHPEDFDMPANVFTESSTEALRVRITGAAQGTYLVKTYTIDRDHSNVFGLWKSMNFLTPHPGSDMEEFRAKSELSPEISVAVLKDSDPFSLTLSLNAGSVVLVTCQLYES